MLELTVRLVASLAIVVGLMLLLARFVGKRYGTRAGALVQVLHRQPLSRTAGVAVIAVGGRVLLVGTTDHQVSLLAELDPDELDLEQPPTDEHLVLTPGDLDRPAAGRRVPAGLGPASAHGGARPAEAARGSVDEGALTGSVLSPQTWRQAFAAATGKAP